MQHLWVDALKRQLQRGACALVSVGPVKGSAPRESGCRMIVTENEFHGSIGGGNLEFKALETARGLLEKGPQTRTELYGLGPNLNQCCGGAVKLRYEVLSEAPAWLQRLDKCLSEARASVLISSEDGSLEPQLWSGEQDPHEPPAEIQEAAARLLDKSRDNGEIHVIRQAETLYWLERIDPQCAALYLFGAGHVGKAVIHAMPPMPFKIIWNDVRAEQFPQTIPRHVEVSHEDPLTVAAQAPAQSWFLLMTHSHRMDEALCGEILQRDDFAWLGLIGSESKRRRFVSRLGGLGIPQSRLQRLVCPIGIAGVPGKHPATIAVAVAAQLLMQYEQAQ